MPKQPRQASGWITKFANAFRGTAVGAWRQNSFLVHIPAAIAALIGAWYWQISLAQGCLIVLCIAIVIVAELFNSALELLARSITDEVDPHVRDALDAASGAVLVAAIAATIVGATILGAHAFK